MRTLGANAVLGVDLAKWQGPDVPFDRFEEAKISFSISKATHGASSTPDPTFRRNFKESKILKVRGVYTWFLPDVDPIRQCDRLLEEIELAGGITCGDVIGVDVEEVNTTIKGAPLLDRLRKLLAGIRAGAKIIPLVYTGDWYWKGFCDDAAAEDIGSTYPNWHAQYPGTRRVGTEYAAALAALPPSPNLARPWRARGARIWQMDGDHGLVLPNGTDADFNVFDGTVADLRAWAQSLWEGTPITTEFPPSADNGAPATSLGDESNRLADERSTSRVPHLTDLDD
jgi:GH25 family lysozyme M1 (1,4-beta-N-acetylmuramidase)